MWPRQDCAKSDSTYTENGKMGYTIRQGATHTRFLAPLTPLP